MYKRQVLMDNSLLGLLASLMLGLFAFMNVPGLQLYVVELAEKYVPEAVSYTHLHMLSTGAFNALLKTLEEPPQNVIFILATTEPHKIPLTIISRTQRFDFKRISTQDIVDHMAVSYTHLDVYKRQDQLFLYRKV